MMKKLLPILAALFICGCGKTPDDGGNGTQTPVAPSAITLSSSSVDAGVDGGSFDITIKAPARPKAGTLPSWIKYSDGIFKDYSITVTLKVESNPAYEPRSAEIEFSCSGASPVKLTVTQAAREVVKDPSLPQNGAVAMSEALGLGWNMGNHFDAYYNGSWAGSKEGYPDEEVWGGTKATQATFDGVKRAGFTSVRIPVSWLKMIGDAPDYKIDETWMNRVYEVVQFAHNSGLFVIINTHHDENHGVDNTYQWQDIKAAVASEERNNAIKAEITAVWTQIAGKFKDCGDWLIMEGFNEINDGGWGWSADFRADPTRQCNILNQWNQTFVDAVRATGGNNATRWLGVPTYAANPDFVTYFAMPEDSAGKLMISVHFYNPSSYTIGTEQYQQWGHTGAAGKKDGYGEEEVKACFNNLFTNYVAKDIPVYIGEFGCSMRSKSDTVGYAFFLYYLEYVAKAAKVFGMPSFLWDNGSQGVGQEQHGYINHGTGEIGPNADEAIAALMRARFNTDPNYTLESVYNSAPQF